MDSHEKRDDRAQRRAREILRSLGRELREARLAHDLSQAEAARAIGMSKSSWSRVERDMAPWSPLLLLARMLGVVGLDLSVRT